MGATGSVVEIAEAVGKERPLLGDTERKENNDQEESRDISRHYIPDLGDDGVVDHFVKEMFIGSPKIDALQHVLSNEAGRVSFMDFLRTEYAEENLSFFIVSSHN